MTTLTTVRWVSTAKESVKEALGGGKSGFLLLCLNISAYHILSHSQVSTSVISDDFTAKCAAWFTSGRKFTLLLDMGTSWYFSWKLNYFGILEWKEGSNSYTLSCRDCGMLKRPFFISEYQNNSNLMKNISWCPCLNGGWISILK